MLYDITCQYSLLPMTTKRNWLELKHKFITGAWQTISDFLRDQNIPNNSRSRSHTSGWRDEKLEYQSKIITRIQEKEVESVVDIRLRQQQIAKKMQEVGLQKLQELSPETTEEARKLVTSGLQEERAALGMSEKRTFQNLTQVNVNLPKTKIDEILDGENIEDLLGLIADIRKEKERRKLLNIDF